MEEFKINGGSQQKFMLNMLQFCNLKVINQTFMNLDLSIFKCCFTHAALILDLAGTLIMHGQLLLKI